MFREMLLVPKKYGHYNWNSRSEGTNNLENSSAPLVNLVQHLTTAKCPPEGTRGEQNPSQAAPASSSSSSSSSSAPAASALPSGPGWGGAGPAQLLGRARAVGPEVTPKDEPGGGGWGGGLGGGPGRGGGADDSDDDNNDGGGLDRGGQGRRRRGQQQQEQRQFKAEGMNRERRDRLVDLLENVKADLSVVRAQLPDPGVPEALREDLHALRTEWGKLLEEHWYTIDVGQQSVIDKMASRMEQLQGDMMKEYNSGVKSIIRAQQELKDMNNVPELLRAAVTDNFANVNLNISAQQTAMKEEYEAIKTALGNVSPLEKQKLAKGYEDIQIALAEFRSEVQEQQNNIIVPYLSAIRNEVLQQGITTQRDFRELLASLKTQVLRGVAENTAGALQHQAAGLGAEHARLSALIREDVLRRLESFLDRVTPAEASAMDVDTTRDASQLGTSQRNDRQVAPAVEQTSAKKKITFREPDSWRPPAGIGETTQDPRTPPPVNRQVGRLPAAGEAFPAPVASSTMRQQTMNQDESTPKIQPPNQSALQTVPGSTVKDLTGGPIPAPIASSTLAPTGGGSLLPALGASGIANLTPTGVEPIASSTRNPEGSTSVLPNVATSAVGDLTSGRVQPIASSTRLPEGSTSALPNAGTSGIGDLTESAVPIASSTRAPEGGTSALSNEVASRIGNFTSEVGVPIASSTMRQMGADQGHRGRVAGLGETPRPLVDDSVMRPPMFETNEPVTRPVGGAPLANSTMLSPERSKHMGGTEGSRNIFDLTTRALTDPDVSMADYESLQDMSVAEPSTVSYPGERSNNFGLPAGSAEANLSFKNMLNKDKLLEAEAELEYSKWEKYTEKNEQQREQKRQRDNWVKERSNTGFNFGHDA